MTVLVTDNGFAPDDWTHGTIPLAAVSDVWDTLFALGIDFKSPELSAREWGRLGQLLPRTGLIRICVRNFGDMEAFDLAKAIRMLGYTGRLRAHGAMLARCYTLARRVGFDEIELSPQQACRQPRELWRNIPDWNPDRRGARRDGSTQVSRH